MSYSEENDQVILRMSREDYGLLLRMLGYAKGYLITRSGNSPRHALLFEESTEFVNRLNSGNPHYTPYEVKR